MLILGLTGSIGMGKSTVAAMFARRGVPVFDADAEVHRLYAGPAVAKIRDIFPGVIRERRVDRSALAARLAGDPGALGRLEAVVHPLVEQAERDFARAANARGKNIILMEIPLLFEAGRDERMDATVVVSAPEHVQRARALARPGMTPEKLALVLKRQMPDAEKRLRADFVVDTSTSLADTERAVDTILTALDGREGQAFAREFAD